MNNSEEHFNGVAGAAGVEHYVPEEVEVNNYGCKSQTEALFMEPTFARPQSSKTIKQ